MHLAKLPHDAGALVDFYHEALDHLAVLGLQRAFQVAGARTLVTSLWKVDDQATRQLMERFYESYWKNGRGAQDAGQRRRLL